MSRILVFCGTREAVQAYNDREGWLKATKDFTALEREKILGDFARSDNAKLAVDRSFLRGWLAPADTLILFDPSWSYPPNSPENMQALSRTIWPSAFHASYPGCLIGKSPLLAALYGYPEDSENSVDIYDDFANMISSKSWLCGLDAGQKDDRADLSQVFKKIAEIHGAKLIRSRWTSRRIDLLFILNNVTVKMSIDGVHGGHRVPIYWAVDKGSYDFTAQFKAAIGTYGRQSWGRGTSSGASWFELAMSLHAGLKLAACGDAIEP